MGTGQSWAFLTSGRWEVAYHTGFVGMDVLAWGQMDCLAELNFRISLTVVLKKKNKINLDAPWDSFWCVF